jgi:hypothetical protein
VPLRRTVPLQRGVPPTRRVPVPKMRSLPRRGPERSPEYLAWIRTLPCVVCLRVSGWATVVEAGPRGMSQKASDFSAIPLCSGHHRRTLDSYHRLGEQEFSHTHGIDLEGLVQALRSRFCEQGPASHAVRAVVVG